MLLSIRGLSVTFDTLQGPFMAIEGIDLDVDERDTLAIVGESGCGKSVLGHATMRLLDDIATMEGSVKFKGREVYSMGKDELLGMRGKAISLIPQSPSTSFNPVIKIGDQIKELIEKDGIAKGTAARQRAIDFLGKAGFPDPAAIYESYPHRLSGGMCERALIAMAVSVEPELIIADEPTKGLDALSRKNILAMLHKMAEGASMIMITHDFKAAATCNRLAVMYSGEIVEEGTTASVLESPKHFYTKGLLEAQPSRSMKPIKGRHSLLSHKDAGCRFRGRCDAADTVCKTPPLLRELDGRGKVRCHHA
jgi:peptide/nickel transport system ATP-binding protein